MRISNYEIFIPLVHEGYKLEKFLLFNGLYGAVDVITDVEAEKIKHGDVDSLPLSLRERLHFRGHLLSEDDFDEIDDVRLLSRIQKIIGRNNINLVIMPTYDCNFRCPYCFERHRLSNGQNWLNQAMSLKTVKTIFTVLEKYKSQGYHLGNCTLYGGEPLLKKNISLVKSICEYANNLGMPINAVTNGYDLESYVDVMRDFSFKDIQVTLDGAYEVNDVRRVHKDGKPSYERIVRNIQLALNNGVDVILRVNVNRENLCGIKDLICDLEDKGFLDDTEPEINLNQNDELSCPTTQTGYFTYYFKATTEDSNSRVSLKEKDVFDELIRIGMDIDAAIELQSQYSMFLEVIERLLEGNNYLDFSPCFCGSESGMIVVDPFGNIFPCWDSVAKKDDIIGITDLKSNRFLFNFNRAKWRARTADNIEKCRTCPYIFVCRGGCASRAFIKHGSYFREFCGESKEIFNFVAAHVIGSAWIKNQKNELSLSLKAPISELSKSEREIILKSNSQKEIFTIVMSRGFFH